MDDLHMWSNSGVNGIKNNAMKHINNYYCFTISSYFKNRYLQLH